MQFWTILLLSFALFTYSRPAYAEHAYLRDSKIAEAEANELAVTARQRGFRSIIVINPEVLTELNRLLGTPGRRKHIRECLRRMKVHGPHIARELERRKLPQELLAIPLIESGYQNIHSPHGTGSGLWMFIKLTAKTQGLKITTKTDQRLHVKKSTAAALTYLQRNQRTFNDWKLTLLAYNLGETKVKKAIKKARTRDVWKLTKKGHERDPGYVAKVIAASLIVAVPEIILFKE